MVKNGFKQYFMASESNPFIFYIFTFYGLGFYELCAWTRPKSWVPHSKSYGTSVSLAKDVVGFCISKLSSRHTLTFSRKKGKCCIHALSQQGQFCSHPMGAGGRTEPQSTGLERSLWTSVSLENLQNWLRSPPCVDLDPGWHSLSKYKCPIIISEIKQMPFNLFPNMGWTFFFLI